MLRLMADDQERGARAARANARRLHMTVEVVNLGQPKLSPYANSSPEERLEAATRLMEQHAALRGTAPILPRSAVPRSEWPGEAFVCGREHD